MSQVLPASSALSLPWAKYDAETDQFHPLLAHLLDVAAVAERLWPVLATPELQSRLASAWGLDEEGVWRWFVVGAGLHDIGKATSPFQAKVEGAAKRIARLGLRLGTSGSADDIPHGRASAILLPDLLEARLRAGGHEIPNDTTGTFLRPLADSVGGHHGTFSTGEECCKAKSKLASMEQGPWGEVRSALVGAFLDVVLEGARLPVPAPDPDRSIDGFLFLAGFTSVADWIGSMSESFAFHDPVKDHAAYWRSSLDRADKALELLGWSASHPSELPALFAKLFPAFASSGKAVRPVQALAERIAREDRPHMVVVEVPMGEGKTEAALLLAHAARQARGERGAYFALPTTATSNQMFGRVQEFLERTLPEEARRTDLHLLHGQSMLDDGYVKLKLLGVGEPGETEPMLVASEWFLKPKRGLLAPFAVGTVDQSLLAALQCKHWFVRLAGLAGKTLVFDEVHAYDAYMNRIFERLLEWLGRLGTTVVILSATLPRERVARLFLAFSGKLPKEGPRRHGADEATDSGSVARVVEGLAPYPRTSWISDTSDKVRSEGVEAERRSEPLLERVEDDLPKIFGVLRERLAAGGSAAWICNTVGRAQDVFKVAKEHLPGESFDALLFHARFPLGERLRRETEALERFKRDRPLDARPVLLVATQVVEQSLDLDFDLMLTEHAPADLLLQRSGRLHRHPRPRPAGLERPTLVVIEPKRKDEEAACALPDFGSSGFVYAPAILARSWIALRGSKRNPRTSICVPDDVEGLIESVYGIAPPEGIEDDEREALAKLDAEFHDEMKKRKNAAKKMLVDGPVRGLEILTECSRELEEDNPDDHKSLRAETRWSESPTVRVICARREGDRLLLHAPGGEAHPIDESREPRLSDLRALFEASVSLSYKGCDSDFPRDSIPERWKKSRLVRHWRMAVFENGEYRTGRRILRLNPELGIVFEKNEESDD